MGMTPFPSSFGVFFAICSTARRMMFSVPTRLMLIARDEAGERVAGPSLPTTFSP